MSGLTARERRLVAILILLAIVAGVCRLAIIPFVDGFSERRDARERLSLSFEHNQRLIESIPMLRRRAEAQQADRRRFALAAPSPAIAQDRLKERLGDRLAAAGGELSGMEDVSASPGWVGASIQGTLTLAQLVALLDELQNQQPYLVVTDMTIVADRALQSGKLDEMDVKIEVAIPFTRAA